MTVPEITKYTYAGVLVVVVAVLEGLLVVSSEGVPCSVVDARIYLEGNLHAVAEFHHSHLAVVVAAAGVVVARFHNFEVDRIRDRYILHNLRSRNPDIPDRNIHHTLGPVPGPATPQLDEEVACDCRTVSEGEDLADMAVLAGTP